MAELVGQYTSRRAKVIPSIHSAAQAAEPAVVSSCIVSIHFPQGSCNFYTFTGDMAVSGPVSRMNLFPMLFPEWRLFTTEINR